MNLNLLHAYAFQFKWQKMKELTLDISELYNQLKDEINKFINSLN